MNFKKIVAGILSIVVLGGAVPFAGAVLPDYSIMTSAADEEYTEGTYGVLTYKNYGDHIEISGCDESAAEVEIPSEIDGVTVTSIGRLAFQSCKSITSITIPHNVTSIGTGAFYFCTNLISVTIPDSVASIENSAFYFCTNLTSVKIPDSVTSIGEAAFDGTKWLENKQAENPLVIVNNILINGATCEGDVIIPESVTSICNYAFYGCASLTSITIPDSVTSIGVSAFIYCTSLTSITIENSECEIYDSKYTISDTATIYGYENSTAQAYAEKYGRNFASLGEAPAKVIYGDADGDGALGISDVVKVMMYASNKENSPMIAEELDAADVYNRGDGVFVSDALSIQKKLAQVIEALPESLMQE